MGKKIRNNILQKSLRFMAQALVRKHQPQIVGVTGSIGKTATRDAIVHVLGKDYNVYGVRKNYNNEIGVPLTIIGAGAGGSSLFGWLRVVIVWIRQMTRTDYPEILVMEYGIDHPGDMDVLAEIASPCIAVVTRVTGVHGEFFEGISGIAAEKGKLVENISCVHGTHAPCAAILNRDDKRVWAMSRKTTKAVYSYGFSDEADFVASHVQLHDRSQGISFKLNIEGRSVPIRLPLIIGEHNVSGVLAAISVAQLFKVNLVDIAQRLLSYHMPSGRMRLLEGKDQTSIIDDTYNASPEAVIAAIVSLQEFASGRSVAVLGDMLELGSSEDALHVGIGVKLSQAKIDVVISVGKRMAIIGEELQKNGYTLGENLFLVDSPDEAMSVVDRILMSGDTFLVKGSQGMRMEKVVASILAPEYDASELLCRQDDSWKKKSFVQP